MKLVRYALIVLVATLSVNFVNSFAVNTVPSTNSVPINFCTIPAGGSWSTDLFGKNNDFQQSYHWEESMTDYTPRPCSNCKFKVTLQNENNGKVSSITGVYHENKYFNAASKWMNNYKVKIERDQWTTATSYHTAEWYIMKPNPWEPLP